MNQRPQELHLALSPGWRSSTENVPDHDGVAALRDDGGDETRLQVRELVRGAVVGTAVSAVIAKPTCALSRRVIELVESATILPRSQSTLDRPSARGKTLRRRSGRSRSSTSAPIPRAATLYP
jgi:hypothetical protein